ncbi:hypothetical protein [Phenylobacterium montanum]|uniref:Uncharacterized protein n=1 Tax=Phenylobacterium montanum TaxID=2823693 RepID=A0A975IVU0_9CAUL|nr:hypothetical protein [Caulobacter sp. S6]QUD89130.1 hypothetical protein KCG34_04380 [Caulobacter sp. S6]
MVQPDRPGHAAREILAPRSALALGVACTPLATNAGQYWPTRGVLRKPGVIIFEYLEPIPPGLDRAAFMQALEQKPEVAGQALIAENASKIQQAQT